jgi:membrane protease YdiL (CAAX protease family)
MLRYWDGVRWTEYASPMPQPLKPAEQVSRPALRGDMWKIVLCLLGFFAVQSVVIICVLIVAMMVELLLDPSIFDSFANYSLDASMNAIMSSPFMARMMNYIWLGQILGVVVGVAIFLPLRGKKLLTSDITAVNERIGFSTVAKAFILIMGIQFLLQLVTIFFTLIGDATSTSMTDSYSTSMTSLLNNPVGIVYAVLLGPIVEEIVFRGAIMRRLDRFGANFAIVTQALIFALYHGFFTQMIFAFPVGLILGYLARRHSLKWAMLVHILNNGFATVLTILMTTYPDLGITVQGQFLNAFDLGSQLFFLLCFIISIVIIATNHKKIKQWTQTGAPRLPRPYAAAYSHPTFIIFIILMVLMGVSLTGMA